jgi:hypothetical protein
MGLAVRLGPQGVVSSGGPAHAFGSKCVAQGRRDLRFHRRHSGLDCSELSINLTSIAATSSIAAILARSIVSSSIAAILASSIVSSVAVASASVSNGNGLLERRIVSGGSLERSHTSSKTSSILI